MVLITPNPDVQIEMTNDAQWVQTMGTVVDPKWWYEDAAGHHHSGTEFTATTTPVYGDPYWCDDCQDEHRDLEGYMCSTCGDNIEPRMVRDPGRWIPGHQHVTMTVTANQTITTYELSSAARIRLADMMSARQTIDVPAALSVLDALCYVSHVEARRG